MEKLTIFTPTFNRASKLQKLYNSLILQTCKNFVWLVVDDGSTDNTCELIHSWIFEKKIEIKYLYQKNQGKMVAHNVGVKNTDTSLFVCVDSDDYLVSTAVEIVLNEKINNPHCIGMIYCKGLKEEEPLTNWNPKIEYETMLRAEQKYGLKGDSMIVIKTSALEGEEFPYFQGEKFVPEAYLYDRLSLKGVFKFVRRVLYVCEYLDDGYTKNIRSVIKKNPLGYEAFILQRLNFDKGIKNRFLDTIRYIAILRIMKKPIFANCPYKCICFLAFFPGLLFFTKEYKCN